MSRSSPEPFAEGAHLQPNKVCPVVLRRSGGGLDILAFEHPLAGRQLVKGTIEPGEDVAAAALRELAEESGIKTASASRMLGVWSSGFERQVWAFAECVPEQPLPDAWAHDASDDGGHTFRFFWHPLHQPADPACWHLVFREAMQQIAGRIRRHVDTGRVALHQPPWAER